MLAKPFAFGVDCCRNPDEMSAAVGVCAQKFSADWNSLPSVLVGQLLSWLGHSASMAALQSSCKAWRNVPLEKVDAVWKAQYLRDFDVHSQAHPLIANDGEQTSWKQRCANRARIEQNWLNSRCASHVVEIDGSGFHPSASLDVVLCYNNNEMFLFDMNERKETKRWRAESTGHHIRHLNIDRSTLPERGVSLSTCGEISVWSVQTGERLAHMIVKPIAGDEGLLHSCLHSC